MSDRYDDITLRDVKRMAGLCDMLMEAAAQHALAIFADGVADHECGLGTLSEDEMEDAPEFSAKDVEMLLALEHAMLANHRILRVAMRQQGYPVEEQIPVDQPNK